MSWFNKFRSGFTDTYGEGRVDHHIAHLNAREDRGQNIEAPRAESMFGSDPTFTRLRGIFNKANPEDVEARRQMGMGAKKDRAEQIGQIMGTLASDLTQDRMREKWWLFNAPQAAISVGTEMMLGKVRPELFSQSIVRDAKGKPVVVDKKDPDPAVNAGILDDVSLRRRKGYGIRESAKFKPEELNDTDKLKEDRYYYTKRNYEPGFVDSLLWPSGLAINAGIGLLTPNVFGGYGGYTAALPSDEDKTVSQNAIAEVAAKYFLGRTGDLLPYDQFVEHRPDISKDEYRAYKAFKYDKDIDLNPLDGDVTFPAGVLKATAEGIHGPEIQFLGRSIPATTAITPITGALLGTYMGVQRPRPIRGGFMGGMAGLAVGQIAGNLIEQERRNRNMRENFPKSEAVVPELR